MPSWVRVVEQMLQTIRDINSLGVAAVIASADPSMSWSKVQPWMV
jgi:hypothetical protein